MFKFWNHCSATERNSLRARASGAFGMTPGAFTFTLYWIGLVAVAVAEKIG